MTELSMPRHQVWRHMYRGNRYCRMLTQVEINQRIRDIFLSMLRLTPEAKVGLAPMDVWGCREMLCKPRKGRGLTRR